LTLPARTAKFQLEPDQAAIAQAIQVGCHQGCDRPHAAMRKLLRAISSVVLWSYDRGSWPYDVMVVAIVLFVLITPRKWFHDQPQNAAGIRSGIIVVSRNPVTHIETLRLYPNLFADSKDPVKVPNAKTTDDIREILGNSAGDLKNANFRIQKIQAIRASDGSLLYYEVQIKR